MPLSKIPGLVMHLPLNESSGSTAYDNSRYGNDGSLGGGTPANMPVWVDRGLRFDGVDDYVDCGNDASIQLTGDMSLSAWVKVSLGANSPIIAKDAGSADRGWYFSMLLTGEARALIAITATTIAYFTTDNAIVDGVWTKMDMIYGGSEIAVYFDGIKQTGTQIGVVPATQRNSTINVIIGKLTTARFNGSIDQVRIHNRALSASNIVDLYNSEKHKYV